MPPYTALFQYKTSSSGSHYTKKQVLTERSRNIVKTISSVPQKNDILVLVPVQVEQNEVVDVDIISSVQQDGDDFMSSSIGVLSNGKDTDDEDGEEIQSEVVAKEGALNSLATLEAALPFKRGLSNYYDGKSRTFMNLGEVKNMEELQKEESPMNKRRRLTMAQTSLYSSSSMPHLTHTEGEDTHNVEVEQDFKSSTSNTSLNSTDSHPPSHP